MDAILHILGGFIVAGIFIVSDLPKPWVIAALFWFGLLREMWQHSWQPPDSWHVVAEALGWPIGALLAALLFS